jgi:hypothetical protein
MKTEPDRKVKELSKGGLSPEDRRKISTIVTSMRSQLTLYGYKSFITSEITLAEDNLRPIAEVLDRGETVQREIGLNDSASDGTRLKWAYYLAILALAKNTPINHFQLAIFDEPGQQEMKWEDLQEFLRWIAKNIVKGQQVIVSTSESFERINTAVAGMEVNVLNFDGFILQPLS